ncbi:MAG: hypothetical protein KI786_17210 [Mameliella sp.]|nr:hypothetical protein [Phaeodactylibacter sp.]
MSKRPRILIACLDWGLGHAARSLPIADEVKSLGAEPVLASAGAAGLFLRAERPKYEYLSLPSYNIHYRWSNMVLNMTVQGPKISRVIWKEHFMLKQYIREYKISGIISDNRFGCFSNLVPSIFLTHQLYPIMPTEWVQSFVNQLLLTFITQYRECWVPDLPDENNLSGRLSHPAINGTPCHYVGFLSRFSKRKKESYTGVNRKNLAILSGPEPQRTYLEQKLIRQFQQIPGEHILVRGIPNEDAPSTKGNTLIHAYLKGERLWQEISNAKLLIGRPGYSSLMDWSIAGQKVLCIPTPGQTEQEYLAKRLHEAGKIEYQSQKNLHLQRGIEHAMKREGLSAPDSGSLLRQNLERFIAMLPSA